MFQFKREYRTISLLMGNFEHRLGPFEPETIILTIIKPYMKTCPDHAARTSSILD